MPPTSDLDTGAGGLRTHLGLSRCPPELEQNPPPGRRMHPAAVCFPGSLRVFCLLKFQIVAFKYLLVLHEMQISLFSEISNETHLWNWEIWQHLRKTTIRGGRVATAPLWALRAPQLPHSPPSQPVPSSALAGTALGPLKYSDCSWFTDKETET